MIKGYGLILLSILFGFISQVFFKEASLYVDASFDNLYKLVFSIISNIYFIGALFLYALSALFWILGLKNTPLAMAFSLTSFNYVLIVGYSAFFLSEVIPVTKIISVFLIIFGVFIMMNKRFITSPNTLK